MEHEKARRIADRLAQYEMEELLADRRYAAKKRAEVDEFGWWNWYGKPLLGFLIVVGSAFTIFYLLVTNGWAP